MTHGPLIVQSDKSLLLEVDHPLADAARKAIAPFAELERAPEHIHTYRLTNLGLWNARAAGMDAEQVVHTLVEYSRFPVPHTLLVDVAETMSRYGRLTLMDQPAYGLVLHSTDRAVLAEVLKSKRTAGLVGDRIDAETVLVHPSERGRLKQALIKLGWPADDQAGYVEGQHFDISLRTLALPRQSDLPRQGSQPSQPQPQPSQPGQSPPQPSPSDAVPQSDVQSPSDAVSPSDASSVPDAKASSADVGQPWSLRPYQQQAVDAFWYGGSGVVVLPCGAGKTLVGAAALATSNTTALILVTNTVSARQWRDELLRFTTLKPEEIGEYSGARKEIKPVTIATYQVMTTKRAGAYAHLDLLDSNDWGLVIYDEVHLLPAPIFRMTADLQARRRLGLTATLVREDGREDEVFSLIGPKRYDAPWKDIEAQGYIAPADCCEVRLTLPEHERMRYATAEPEEKYRLAASAAGKEQVVDQLLALHAGEQVLIIGQYLDQLESLAGHLGAPLITGNTAVGERQRLYDAFRTGEITVLVVSKVANFSIDLPEASVAIQVSGAFGSRQEEAQRLGRVMRPKADGKTAHFYAVVARDTVDQDFAAHRQRFLAEQGYAYRIIDAEDVSSALTTGQE